MQNKGFVRVFAVLLTLVCLFYLSFSVVTNYYTKKAEKYAEGDNLKLKNYLDSLSTEKVWLGYTFKQCRELEIGLGLDLKGGMNVVLEMSAADVLKSLSTNDADENFNKALVAARKRQATSSQDFVSLFVEEYKKIDPNGRLSAIFSSIKLKNKVTPNSTNEEVEKVLRSELNDALSNSFNVLRTRIDRFGVVAPNIQRLERDGRILVELPGIKDPERVRNLLKGSANLEFWETYDLSEIYQALLNANTLIADLQKSDASANPVTEEKKDSTLIADITAEGDSLPVEIKEVKDVESDLTNQSDLEKKNPLFAKLMPYISQQGIGQGPAVGQAHYRDTAAVNAYLAMKPVRELLPRNLIFKWTVKPVDEKEQYYQLVALKVTNRNGHAALEGDVITDAREDFDRTTNTAVVSMSMNAEGAKTWARLTKENIGRCIAIVLDDYVYSFPRVNDEIKGGNSQISGHFTPEEAKDLANVLKSGKMAASVNIVSEEIVGPSLGHEAIQSGIWSFIFALILLMIYMISMYGVVPGLVANVGLIINMFFTVGVLASFQAVLTLAGIAGLVLSLGMAVDANVLIYERAKEELRLGKNLRTAVENAYKNAFSAIFDSNLTSVITGLVLFYFGTGPIKGFATTLIIGIISSFFVTIFLSRMFYEKALEKEWIKNLSFTTKISKHFLVNTHFDFLGHRKIGYIITGVMLLLSTVSFFVRGLNLGIDFTGGRNYIVRFEEPVVPSELATLLKPEFEGNSLSVITIGGDNQVRISTNYKITDTGDEVEVEQEILNKIYTALKPVLPAGTTFEQFSSTEYIQSSQKVGPSIAEDITKGAFWAVIFSLLGMGLYILIRFRDIAFSIGTVASVVNNTYVIIGFYSLLYGILPFSMEIDQSFIAAILTVIGYSVNDTVVIFDRIREVNSLYPKSDKRELINGALNSTLARTFNTSISTALVLICIFILGGDTIRSFTFAMLFGVIVGTYATLFIAVPTAYEIQKRKTNKKEAVAK